MKVIILALLRVYQRVFSFDSGLIGKLIPLGRVCRFTPTCSEYTYQAVEAYGIITGLWLGVKRIIRCHPWSPGGSDPVPRHT